MAHRGVRECRLAPLRPHAVKVRNTVYAPSTGTDPPLPPYDGGLQPRQRARPFAFRPAGALVCLAPRCPTQNAEDHSTRRRSFLSSDLPRSPLAAVFGAACFGAFQQGNGLLPLGRADSLMERRLDLVLVGTGGRKQYATQTAQFGTRPALFILFDHGFRFLNRLQSLGGLGVPS